MPFSCEDTYTGDLKCSDKKAIDDYCDETSTKTEICDASVCVHPNAKKCPPENQYVCPNDKGTSSCSDDINIWNGCRGNVVACEDENLCVSWFEEDDRESQILYFV